MGPFEKRLEIHCQRCMLRHCRSVWCCFLYGCTVCLSYPHRKSIKLKRRGKQHINVWSHTWDIWGASPKTSYSFKKGISLDLMPLWILINKFEVCSFVCDERHAARKKFNERWKKSLVAFVEERIRIPPLKRASTEIAAVFPFADEGFFIFNSLFPSLSSFSWTTTPTTSFLLVNYVRNPQ